MPPDSQKLPPPSLTARLTTRSRTPSVSISRTTSRAPSPSSTRSPLPATLRPVPSFSSIQAKGKRNFTQSAPTVGSPQRLTATAMSSHLTLSESSPSPSDIDTSSNSAADMSTGMEGIEGILVKDEETDIRTEMSEGESESSAKGYPDVDEEARQELRDRLRRTLRQKREMSLDSSRKGKHLVTDELEAPSLPALSKPRQYFVLTDAGKPVFASSPLNDDQDALASTMGLMQALISVFLDDDDKLRYIVAGRMHISFLLRSPLYLVCVSSWGEPESVIRSHMEYLHLQILSIVSGAQLRRIFERRTNFDLRRLLTGAETLLDLLLTRLQTDLAMSTSSLICMALDANLRRKAGDALIPSKIKDVLYVLLIARGRVITLVRPKKHSVHPADLHILLNTIHAPAIFDSSASWLPICLPKFNPSGFLHAYVTFPRHSDLLKPLIASRPLSPSSSDHETHRLPSGQSTPTPAGSYSNSRAGDASPNSSEELPTNSAILVGPPKHSLDTDQLKGRIGFGLVCVSGGGGDEFDAIRTWSEKVISTLESSGVIDSIQSAIRNGATEYTVSSLGIPGLRHFIFKSRPHVQVTHPSWDEDYTDSEARRRLITLYQTLHDAIHAKSGQKETLKLQYIKTDQESVMGWITQLFEIYISVSPNLPKSAVVATANAVVRWVKREEANLFLRNAPVF